MSAAVVVQSRIERAWQVLGSVPDPEVLALSVVDLGIVREVSAAGDGGLDIVLTPTYSGCPATEAIEMPTTSAPRKSPRLARTLRVARKMLPTSGTTR